MKKFALLLVGIGFIIGWSGCIVLPSGDDYGYDDHSHHHRHCDDDGGLRVQRR